MRNNKRPSNREPRKANHESRKAIPYGKQNITQSDIDAVTEVLKSDYLTQGPKIAEFEEAFAQYVGSKYAVAVSSGTAALHLCTMVLGVKPGDKVITTPITFAASANCVRYCGGEVVFADIDPQSYLLDIDKIRELLQATPKGTYRGIIPVDFAGRAVDMEAFRKLADEHDLWIIEDACHAPGGSFIDSHGKEQKCGNGNYADLAIFSFHPVKHIAAGEGGMITTNNKALYEKLLMLRTHGITRDPDSFQNSLELAAGHSQFAIRNSPTTNHEPQTTNHEKRTTNHDYPSWYMEMQSLGYNYRLTDIQAALGLSQLQRAEEGLNRRREIAARYYEAFKDIPQITDFNLDAIRNSQFANHEQRTTNNEPRTTNSEKSHAFHLYIIETQDRLALYNYLREHQIFAQIHYIPCHLMPYYRQFGWKEGDMPKAEQYYKACISLPMYPTLTVDEQAFVIQTIKDYYV